MKRVLLGFIAIVAMLGMSQAQPSISDPFFDHVNYIGAFGSSDWTSGWCNWTPQNTTYPATTVTIPAGNITTNTTWTNNNTYLLNGWVYVKSGATLTIQAGTVIRGDYVNKGSLIIERGAQLIAIGTSANPIVFTSNEDAGNRDYGDWGGVILCGRATINVPGDTAVIEGGVGSVYGGGASPNDADNSGTLQYVRIEFAGVPYVADKEINGLTMGAVGSGTTIDHIQVSYCGDDAFEWFGGKVDCKYLVSFRNWDDDFDTDYGYQGRVQYAVSLRDPDIADPGSKSNGFESDNDGNGSTNTPQTAPVFSNFSMFGPKVTPSTTVNTNYKNAMHLRRNTALKVYNSFFAGYTNGLLLDGALCEASASSGNLAVEYCYLAGISGSEFQLAAGSTFDLADWFFTDMDCNDTLNANSELMITDGFNLSAPNFLPTTGSPLLNRPWMDCYAGVSEAGNGAGLKLFPNPASDIVNIEYTLNEKAAVSIRLMDLTGRCVKEVYKGHQAQGMQQLSFSIAGLPGGAYLLEFISPAHHSVQKLFVSE